MINRRHLLATTAAAVLPLPALGQSKPEKLVYVGDNGPWHFAMVEEVAPAFEKATGIKIDFTLLPTDPWGARLKAELGAGSTDIDIVQWSVGMAGWISPHLLDHEPLAGEIIQPVQVDADRRGYVIASGDDPQAALAAANAAIKKLQVVTEATSLPIPQQALSRPR